jgi:isopenicillin N synthase-like dioxygenase
MRPQEALVPASPTIPVLDLATVTGHELLTGLRSASCVFLTGLAAVPAEVDAVVATADAFFGQDEETKAQVQWSGQGAWAGWQPLYAQERADALLLERFEVTLPAPDPADGDESWARHFTQWPEGHPTMPTSWAAYYRSMRALTTEVVHLLADALGLPEADVAPWTTGQHANLVANHYLAQIDPPAEGRVRQQPHTDQGGLTVLWADDNPGGLEARIGPDESWVPVSFPPGAVLLQAGDLLTLWTRGAVPANVHRVVNPPRGEGVVQTDRYSIVYFHHPDLDTWVAPVDDDAAGVSAREHVMARQRRSYSLG